MAGVSGKEFWNIPTITSISDEMSMAESSYMLTHQEGNWKFIVEFFTCIYIYFFLMFQRI